MQSYGQRITLISLYFKGRVSYETFMKAWNTDPAIKQWVENLVDLSGELKLEWEALPSAFYEEELDFYVDTIGEYIGGNEVDEYIVSIMSKFPASMGKTKRKKAAKVALREKFHIEGVKYPRWAQEAEWPMGTNSPMAFVGAPFPLPREPECAQAKP